MITILKILFSPLTLSGRLLKHILLSPWGLVVPMTLLIALIAAPLIRKAPEQHALRFAEQMETCADAELPRFLDVLVRMGDPGVTGLVKGLTSKREPVFTASLKVLQREFDRWTQSVQREHHYRVFSQALLNSCHQFSPTAQSEAMRFVERMMQIRPAASSSPESSANRQKTIAQCEKLLLQLESERRRLIEQGQQGGYDLQAYHTKNSSPTLHANFAPTSNTLASMNQRTSQPVLLASNGQPFVPASARNGSGGGSETHFADAGMSASPLSDPRADRLVAYYQSQENQSAANAGNARFGGGQETSLVASFSPPSAAPQSFPAEVGNMFAKQYPGENSQPAAPNIADDYHIQKRNESGGTFDSDNFISPELRTTPLDRVPQLPTDQLMQLMHHSNPAYIESARRTLMGREGFQEIHMKLAWRLYHPSPAVRREIMDMLPGTPNVQPAVWMTVLLNDPNNDVRFRTASFLATSNDPTLRRLLIERGKRDNDARIINLAERLNAVQR
jgi:hypothetical protein